MTPEQIEKLKRQDFLFRQGKIECPHDTTLDFDDSSVAY